MTNNFMISFIIILVVAIPFALPLIILKFSKSDPANSSSDRRIPPVPTVPPTPPMPTYEEFMRQNSGISPEIRNNIGERPQTANNSVCNNINVSENAPAPCSEVNYAPVSSKNEKVRKKPDMTVSSILFLIGTAFVVLSGIAFGVASWVKTSHEGKVGIICIAAVFAFIFSVIFNKRLKLSGSSISFYILGAGFTATSFLTACYYHIMGSWLSFSGDGCALLMAMTLALLSAILLLGNKLYKRSPLVYTGLSAAALSLFCVVLQIFDTLRTAAPAFIVLQAIITAAVFMTERRIHCNYRLPVERVGIAASYFYGIIPVSYTLSTLFRPDLSCYICICTIIAQLIVYGRITHSKVMISIGSVLNIVLSIMISSTVTETIPDRFFIIVLSSLAIVNYFLNRFIPSLKNAFTESATFAFAVLFGLICVVGANSTMFVPNLIIGVVVSLIIASYIFSKNDGIQLVSGIFSPILPTVITCIAYNCIRKAYTIENTANLSLILWSILAAILILVTAALIFRPASSFNLGHTKDGILHSNLIFSGIILICINNSTLLLLIPLFLCLIHFALSNRSKNNYPTVLSAISFIRVAYNFALPCLEGVPSRFGFDMIMSAVVVIFAVISRVFYKEAILTSNNGKVKLDPLTVTAWLAILPMFGTTKTDAFFALMAIAVFITGFIKKNTSYNKASVILTISTILASLAFITRPFLVPEHAEVSNKITIGIFALTGFICQIIWKRYVHAARSCANVIYILSFVSLLIDAIYFDTAANTIFVMIVMAVTLIISILTRSKTWFTTSATSLFVITIFATKEYLTALNWWVYLFFTGIILIGLAVFNEYCKKNNETLKSTVAKKFSNWNW